METEASPHESASATKEKILNVAEQLFAENGLERVSVRDITNAAHVNLGSINYHFGSKDKLIAEMFERRLIPMNSERIRRLDEAEKAAGNAPASVEAILEAFIRPTIEFSASGSTFTRLLGRILSEPRPCVEALCKNHFDPVRARFDAALILALPHLTKRDIFWRLSFTFGALHHWLLKSPNWTPDWAADGTEAQVQRLIAFAAAGMRSSAGTGVTN